MTGVPGTGKSAIADALGAALPAPVFARDVIEAALWAGGLSSEQGSGRAAYDVMTALAAEELGLGQPVVLDSVAETQTIRDAWRQVAAQHTVPMRVIECICTDARLHRGRLEGRRRDISGWYELTWDDVEDARARYEAWPDDPGSDGRLVLDAVNPLDDNIAAAIAFTQT
jgi:predicted kinase